MQSAIDKYITKPKASLFVRAKVLLVMLCVMLGLEVLDIFLPDHLSPDVLGIRPREWTSLWHIPLSPWLHGDFSHLLSNATPFFILGLIISFFSWRRLVEVAVLATITSGLGVFCFGTSNTNHIGASGVVCGFLGYLVSVGVFQKRPWAMILSIVIGLFYSFTIIGLLLPKSGISWSGHFFGMLGGVLVAYLGATEKADNARL
jgi:membrane associated rhomboid family serine protease